MVTEIIQDVAIVFLAGAVIVETLHLKMLDDEISSLRCLTPDASTGNARANVASAQSDASALPDKEEVTFDAFRRLCVESGTFELGSAR